MHYFNKQQQQQKYNKNSIQSGNKSDTLFLKSYNTHSLTHRNRSSLLFYKNASYPEVFHGINMQCKFSTKLQPQIFALRIYPVSLTNVKLKCLQLNSNTSTYLRTYLHIGVKLRMNARMWHHRGTDHYGCVCKCVCK